MATIALLDVPGPYENEDLALQSQLLIDAGTTLTDGGTDQINVSRKVLVVLHNAHATDPAGITVNGSRDAYGRRAPITAFQLAAGEFAFRWFDAPGWENSVGGGQMDIVASGGTVQIWTMQP